MWIGWTELDLRLTDVHSLKAKRSIVRPIIAELRRALTVSAAETSSVDLYQRSGIGVSLVASERAHVVEVLDRAEGIVAGRFEVEVLSCRQRVIAATDIA